MPACEVRAPSICEIKQNVMPYFTKVNGRIFRIFLSFFFLDNFLIKWF